MANFHGLERQVFSAMQQKGSKGGKGRWVIGKELILLEVYQYQKAYTVEDVPHDTRGAHGWRLKTIV